MCVNNICRRTVNPVQHYDCALMQGDSKEAPVLTVFKNQPVNITSAGAQTK